MRRVRAVWAWLVGSPTRIGAVLVAFVVGLVSGVPAGNKMFDYTWRDAEFCDDCHVHDYANEAWKRSAHVGLTTCHDCHRVPIRHYPRNLWMMVFDRPQGPEDFHAPHIPVVVCAQCHLAEGQHEALTGPMPPEIREHVVRVDESPLHRLHLEEEHDGEPITCMACHGGETNRAHRFEAGQDNCLICHEDRHIPETSGVAALTCKECHFAGFTGTDR